MGIVLSSSDLTQLEAALTTLLSPLSYPSIAEWRAASCAVTASILQADKAMSLIPLAGEPALYADPQDVPAITSWAEYYHQLDTGFLVRRKELGLEVYHRDDLYEAPAVFKSELYNDWCVPFRLYDPLGMGIDLQGEPFPAIIHAYHEKPGSRPFGDRGAALLRLMLPAFKAGVYVCQQLGARRAHLLTMIDRLPVGILLASASGQVLHRTPLLTQALAADTSRYALERELLAVARVVGALGERPRPSHREQSPAPPASRVVRTSSGRYRVSGAWLAPGVAARDGLVLVMLERLHGQPLSDEALRQRYGLTPREIEAARLAVRGHTAEEVAQAMGISTHTARHHLERVRLKLGKRRMGAVGAAMRDAER